MTTPVTATAAVSSAPALPGSGSLLVNLGSALSLVLLLILAGAWLARRCGFGTRRLPGQASLKVAASCTLGPRERVVVVEVEQRWLVLGVTAQQITHLSTLDAPPSAAPDALPPDDRPAFADLLQRNTTK